MSTANWKLIAALLIVAAIMAGVAIAVRPSKISATKLEPAITHQWDDQPGGAVQHFGPTPESDPGTSPVPKFVGYMTMGSDKWFALSLQAEGSTETTEWLGIGQKLGGFEITAFDIKNERLLLKGPAEKHVELTLVVGKVIDSNEELRQRLKELIDTSPRSIRDIHTPKSRR